MQTARLAISAARLELVSQTGVTQTLIVAAAVGAKLTFRVVSAGLITHASTLVRIFLTVLS